MVPTAGDSLVSLAAELNNEVGVVTELTEFPAGGAMLDVRKPDGRGRCALVQDPDGNRIQLTERPEAGS